MTHEIDFDNIRLIKPHMSYISSYRAAILEYRAHGVEDFAYPKVATKREVAAYFDKVDNFRRGIDVPPGYVPGSSFWLVDGRHYLGSGDVRHYLNDSLRRLGGNIGYSIRPAAWGLGLGTRQLAMLLDEAALLRICRPIVTCFDANIASVRIIEKNGGVLLNKIINKYGGKDRLTRIYEIDLTQRF